MIHEDGRLDEIDSQKGSGDGDHLVFGSKTEFLLSYGSSFSGRNLYATLPSHIQAESSNSKGNNDKRGKRPSTAPVNRKRTTTSNPHHEHTASSVGSDAIVDPRHTFRSPGASLFHKKNGLPLQTVTKTSIAAPGVEKKSTKRPMTSKGRIESSSSSWNTEVNRVSASSSTFKSTPLPVRYHDAVTDLSLHNRGPHSKVKGFVQKHKEITDPLHLKRRKRKLVAGNEGLGKYFSGIRSGPGMVQGYFSVPTTSYSEVAGSIRRTSPIVSTFSQGTTSTLLISCSPQELSRIVTDVNRITKGEFSFVSKDGPTPLGMKRVHSDGSNQVQGVGDERIEKVKLEPQAWFYCHSCNDQEVGDDILRSGFCKTCRLRDHGNHHVSFTAYVDRECACANREEEEEDDMLMMLDEEGGATDSEAATSLSLKRITSRYKGGSKRVLVKGKCITLEERKRMKLLIVGRKMNRAAQRGDLKEIENLIANHEGHSNMIVNGTTPFHAALKYGHYEVIELLQRLGGRGDHRSSDNGLTPLEEAQEIYKKKAAERDPRLHADVLYRHLRCRLLLDHTSIYEAAAIGDVHRIEFLVKERRVNVNSQNERGMTGLHYACMKEQLDAVKLLMDLGADSSLSNSLGQVADDMCLSNRFVMYALKVGRREQRRRKERIIEAEKAARKSLQEEKKKKEECDSSGGGGGEVRRRRPVTADSKGRHARRYYGKEDPEKGKNLDFYVNMIPSTHDGRFDHWSRAAFQL